MSRSRSGILSTALCSPGPAFCSAIDCLPTRLRTPTHSTATVASAITLVPKKGGYTDSFYNLIGMDRSAFKYQTWRGPKPEMPLAHSPYDTPKNYGFYFGPNFGTRPGVWLMDPWGRNLEGAPLS